MKNNQYVTFDDVTMLVNDLINQIEASEWEPEIIVGIARSGLVPAAMLSYHFDCPLQPLVWSNTNPETQESNLWLPEDATAGKHTLIVDGIVRTGKTLQCVKDDWDLSVFSNIDWGNTVKIACLHMHETSEVKPEYIGEVINSATKIIYHWESFNAR
jgi:hypoxanthine phosphoribosyltransferase